MGACARTETRRKFAVRYIIKGTVYLELVTMLLRDGERNAAFKSFTRTHNQDSENSRLRCHG